MFYLNACEPLKFQNIFSPLLNPPPHPPPSAVTVDNLAPSLRDEQTLLIITYL